MKSLAPPLSVAALLALVACGRAASGDTILFNGNVATMDPASPTATAIAIRGDRISKVGTDAEVRRLENPGTTRVIDLKGRFVMPGFIEGHGHFSALGASLIDLNFLASRSWDEIVARVGEKAKTLTPGEWIEGRGWLQEKWDSPLERHVLGYPYHDKLSAAPPTTR